MHRQDEVKYNHFSVNCTNRFASLYVIYIVPVIYLQIRFLHILKVKKGCYFHFQKPFHYVLCNTKCQEMVPDSHLYYIWIKTIFFQGE